MINKETSGKDSIDDFLTPTIKDPATHTEAPETQQPQAKPTYQHKSKQPRSRRVGVTTSLSLTPKMLPPLTRRRKAIYELINSGNKVDPRIIDGPRNIEAAPFQLSPMYEIYDRFEEDPARRRKELIFSNDIRVHEYHNLAASVENKNERIDTKIKMPEFINGQAWVDCEAQYLMYVWWELHPQNESNKFRDKTRTPIFKRIDIEFASPHLQLIRRDLAVDAENYVRKLDAEKLINLAAAFGINTTVGISDIRLDLRVRASKNPEEVLFKSSDKKAATMMNIMKCLDLGILDYRTDTQDFFFPGEEEPFFTHIVGETPIDGLTRYLISPEGADDKADVESLLNFWQ